MISVHGTYTHVKLCNKKAFLYVSSFLHIFSVAPGQKKSVVSFCCAAVWSAEK